MAEHAARVVALRPALLAPAPRAELPLAESCRQRGDLRLVLIQPVLALLDTLSLTQAAQVVMQRAARGELGPEWTAAARQKRKISAKSLRTWTKAYLAQVPLADKHKGRQRKPQPWHPRALEMYNRPQRPGFSTVALWLTQEGFAGVTPKAVARLIQSAPAQLGTVGKKRLGAHYYQQNIRPHVVRDNTVLPVGFVYEGDGHCCDVYVQHPARGHFRPELTVWLDVRSQYVVGWWISESESAQTTLFSLSRALIDHDHVPAYVHTDPGSGFRSRMICDETAGFLAKFGIQPMLALPGNARGKGLVEGWFRWFEERLGKTFDSFCGHCRTDDALSRLQARIHNGQIRLPTLAQYIDAIRDYIAHYNANPQQNLGDVAPADLWQQIDRVHLETPAEAVLRPREERTVRRWGVQLNGRKYRAAELQAYEARKVLVEYSVHDDDRVWVLDAKGRLICEAALVEKAPWMPASRIEQAQIVRLEHQRQRRAARDAIDDARSRTPISAAALIDALDAPANDAAIEQHDAVQALDQQHAITVPAPKVRRERAAAPVSAAAQQRLQAQIDEDEAPPTDTPEQRFARALHLETQGCTCDAEATWLRHYQRSAEYHSRRDLHDEFTAL